MSRRPLLISLLGVLVCSVAASPAAAQSPSTLDGETLVALFSKCNNTPGSPGPTGAECLTNPAPPTVEAHCDEDGTSTLHYDVTAAGPQSQGSVTVAPSAAFGPYPGTFREEGTVTIAPQTQDPVPSQPPTPEEPFNPVLTGSNGFDTGPLLTWSARFEIDSGESTVVGRKTLTAAVPGYGVCARLEGEPGPGPPLPAADLTGYSFIADAQLLYSATISTPDGVFRDRGTAQSDLREVFATYLNRDANAGTEELALGADVGLLVEIFKSDLDSPEPAGPEACKRGGFLNFGGLDFKNQGDCVSFFETDGTNEPGQNLPG